MSLAAFRSMVSSLLCFALSAGACSSVPATGGDGSVGGADLATLPPDAGAADSGAPPDAGAGVDATHAPDLAAPPKCDTHVRFVDVLKSAIGTCGGEACHTNGPFAGGLDLTPAHAYADLVNVKSVIAPPQLRVKPGDPDHSFLYRKLTGALVMDGSEGNPMPRSLMGKWSPLSPTQMEMVRCWIAEGAPND